MPSSLRGLIGMQRKLDRGGEGERALRSHQQARQVLLAGKARHRRQYVDVVAADAAKLRGKPRGDLLGFRGAQVRAAAGSDRRCRSAHRRRYCPAAGRTCAACHPPGSHRSRARCRPSARSGSTSSRTSCCRPCRRSCSAHASRDRPGRTAHAGAAPHSDDPARGRVPPMPCAPPDRCAGCGAGASSSRSPARGSPSGRTGWCRRRAAAPGYPPRARSPAPRRRRRSPPARSRRSARPDRSTHRWRSGRDRRG